MSGTAVTPRPSEDRYVPEEYVGKIEPNYYCRGWRPKAKAYCKRRAGSKTDHLGVGRCSRHDGRPPTHGQYSYVRNERLAPLIERFSQMDAKEALNVFPELATARALLYDWVDRFEDYSEALLAWHYSHSERQRPIATDRVALLEAVLDEYEDARTELRGQLTEGEQDRLNQARAFVAFLGSPPPVERPRRILDITTLNALLDTISKMIARIHTAASVNAISRRKFLDVMDMISLAMNEEVRDKADLVRLKNRIRDIRL